MTKANPMTDLTHDEINEMIRCATNKTGAIRPSTRARMDTAAVLVGKGLMEAGPGDVYNLNFYPTIKPLLRRDALVWLSEQGKAVILALNPDDFKANQFWPWPSDIEFAQSQVHRGGF